MTSTTEMTGLSGATRSQASRISPNDRIRQLMAKQGKASLLLVDDDPDLLRLLAIRLKANGYDVTAADINDYLREISGGEFTAKDFRTWNATVLAAVGLAVSERADSDTARERAIARVIQEVAGYLGNTPAVARAAYIDPRVIDSYERGVNDFPGAG